QAVDGGRAARGGTRTQARLAIVDDLRIGETDGDVIAARSEFLEVTGLVGLDERLDVLGAVKRVRLQPFLAACRAIGSRRCMNLVQARVHVGDDGVACQ